MKKVFVLLGIMATAAFLGGCSPELSIRKAETDLTPKHRLVLYRGSVGADGGEIDHGSIIYRKDLPNYDIVSERHTSSPSAWGDTVKGLSWSLPLGLGVASGLRGMSPSTTSVSATGGAATGGKAVSASRAGATAVAKPVATGGAGSGGCGFLGFGCW